MRTELAMLEEMLDAIEPGRVIERASVEARRDRLREELASLLGQGERHWVQTELSGD